MSGFATEPSDGTIGHHEATEALDRDDDIQHITVEPARTHSFLGT
jgi:hypothetical protein